MPDFAHLTWVHYVPILTTVLSAVFCWLLVRRYMWRGRGSHLLWWAFGVFTYGLGTGLEGTITLAGNSVALTKAWYIAGALLGGYPLAQGTVWLLLKRRTAWWLTVATVPVLVVLAVLVVLSPANEAALESHRPGGAVLGWQWLRAFTPLVNGYAAAFLIGGAILSSVRYVRSRGVGSGWRAAGNASIAFGAILPGIGGGMAKAGMVEALYIGEFVGLLFIWAGYHLCVQAPREAAASEAVGAVRAGDEAV